MLELSMARNPEATSAVLPPAHPAQPAPSPPTVFVASSPPPVPAAPLAASEEELQAFPHLELTDPSGTIRWILLKDKELLIGSAADCPLRFDDPLVEPRHAKIIHREDGVFLVDMESGQGVYLNNQRVYREALAEGDAVRVGHRTMIFHLPRPKPEPEAPPVKAEGEAAGQAPPAPAVRKIRKGVPAAIWIVSSVVGVLVIVGIAAGLWYFLSWRSRPQPDALRRTAQGLLDQRDWKKAEEYLARGDGAHLPQPERSRLLNQIQMELDAQEQQAAIAQALSTGDVETALELYYKIPSESVYQPEAAMAIVQHLEARIDAILQRPEADPAAFTEIITMAEKMLQVNPRSGAALSYICLARLGEGNLPEAIQAADALIAANPQAAEGHYYKAFALYRSGRPADAMPCVEEALRLRPNDPDYLLLRSWLFILAGRLEEARLDLGMVLAADPSNRVAQVLYGKLVGEAPEVAAREGPTVTARALLRRRRQTPDLSGAEESACQMFVRGDVDAARKQLADLARRAGPGTQAARYQRLDEQLGRIRQLYEEGRGLAAQDPVAALGRWEEMRILEQTALPGRRSRFTLEVAEQAAALFARQADQDLVGGQYQRAYTLALKALAWRSEQADARGILRQIDDRAEKIYLEGFRHYRQGDLAGAREYWNRVQRTVPEESPWNHKAGEKLAEMEEAQ
jgi:tetratricopeptide (TPR) repeat protein